MAVTYTQVKELIPDCTVSSSIVTAIIADATTFINSVLVDCDNLSASEIDSIIKWFAAHMLASGPCRQTTREKLGDAEVEYNKEKGLDMSSTSFGRMALALDRCGKLKNTSKQAIKIIAVTSFE
jgi:hypothetical protein